MTTISLFALLIFLLINCSEKQSHQYSHLNAGIESLTSNESKQAYLEKIFQDDQKVRGEEGSKLMLQYGKNSEEHIAYVRAQLKQDEINLYKVEKYMELYGHPDITTLGEIAATTPWAVIHHAQGLDARDRNFENLYGAFLNGDIDDGEIAFFLGRMYQMKHGERLQMESPFRSEDEINELVKGLGLEARRAEMENALKD